MVHSDGGHIEYSGESWEILSDLGVLVSYVADGYGRDATLASCLYGLYANSESDMDKIDAMMRTCGYKI